MKCTSVQQFILTLGCVGVLLEFPCGHHLRWLRWSHSHPTTEGSRQQSWWNSRTYSHKYKIHQLDEKHKRNLTSQITLYFLFAHPVAQIWIPGTGHGGVLSGLGTLPATSSRFPDTFLAQRFFRKTFRNTFLLTDCNTGWPKITLVLQVNASIWSHRVASSSQLIKNFLNSRSSLKIESRLTKPVIEGQFSSN